MMQITFIGAAHEVTGSCYILDILDKRIMVDCGMVQGPDIFEKQEIEIEAGKIDFVLLTHAHIDHSGNLPLLYKNGYRGPIFSTVATFNLCEIMLRDSAHIQEFEAEWKNRKALRSNREIVEPIYTMDDADGAIGLFKTFDYNETVPLTDSITVTFIDAGHLLGSSSIKIVFSDDNVQRSIVFSGDIGNLNQPLINDPSYIEDADYIIMESTYGDKVHKEDRIREEEISSLLNRTFERGGNVVVPSFAVGRTQELLYYLRKIKESRSVTCDPDFKVYLDSPLAIEATNIFLNASQIYYDEEARELLSNNINPVYFDNLTFTSTVEESKSINFCKENKVIISASGMCEAGRIRHHLKHNLWNPNNTIMFVGYQAVGTLGRRLLDGVKSVKLFGEDISVSAEIKELYGTSSHADKIGLLKWIKNVNPKPKRVFVTHGESDVVDFFGDLLESNGFKVSMPYPGEIFDLNLDMVVKPGKKKKGKASLKRDIRFEKLKDAGKELSAVIDSLKGHSNKELGKLTDEINKLVEKYRVS